MAYTDDWESLMNGVFGAGGKLKFGGAQPQPEKPQPEKPAGGGLPDLNAALLEQQKQLDEMLKQQNARLKAQDAGVQTALEDSRRMHQRRQTAAERVVKHEGTPLDPAPAKPARKFLFLTYKNTIKEPKEKGGF